MRQYENLIEDLDDIPASNKNEKSSTIEKIDDSFEKPNKEEEKKDEKKNIIISSKKDQTSEKEIFCLHNLTLNDFTKKKEKKEESIQILENKEKDKSFLKKNDRIKKNEKIIKENKKSEKIETISKKSEIKTDSENVNSKTSKKNLKKKEIILDKKENGKKKEKKIIEEKEISDEEEISVESEIILSDSEISVEIEEEKLEKKNTMEIPEKKQMQNLNEIKKIKKVKKTTDLKMTSSKNNREINYREKLRKKFHKNILLAIIGKEKLQKHIISKRAIRRAKQVLKVFKENPKFDVFSISYKKKNKNNYEIFPDSFEEKKNSINFFKEGLKSLQILKKNDSIDIKINLKKNKEFFNQEKNEKIEEGVFDNKNQYVTKDFKINICFENFSDK